MADDIRGSQKLWKRLIDEKAPTGEEFAKALSLASSDFRVKRWWKYGTPAFWDLIRGTIDVPASDIADVVGALARVHGNELQINLEVFPYGVIAMDGAQINVIMERQIEG